MTDKKRLGLRVPCNLYEKLASKATEQGKTINSLCLEVFWLYFKEEDETIRP